jgi:DNA-binding NarL/FixJ family response regulator
MATTTKDWIGLVEAGYTLAGDDRAWLDALLTRAAALSTRGFWPTIGTYRHSARRLELDQTATLGPDSARDILKSSMAVEGPNVAAFFRGGPAVTSLSEALYAHEPALSDAVLRLSDGVVHDKLAVKGLTGQGSAVMLCWLFSERVAPTPQERHRWQCIASHLGAGLRLRELAGALNLEAAPVEAVLDGGGKILDLRAGATRRSARAALRDAVCRLDKLRSTQGRCDPDRALPAWEGLVSGRWSLVDHFDTDGRRFVLALKNDPEFPDPRGLTVRERQVSEFLGQGHAVKEISYMLGLSRSAITNCTARAIRKLGLASLADLAAFFAPAGLRATLAEAAVDGDTLLLGSYPLIPEAQVTDLTAAERAVLAHLLAGSTNQDIAQRRHCSESTVANQVQSIFHKLGVHSRSELALRLQSGS